MGTRDIFHTRRTYYAECEYWIRDERTSIGTAEEWILKNKSNGTFYAREVSSRYNQMHQVANVYAFDDNTISIETDDDISEISRGCIVRYDGELWMVNSVSKSIHRKESEFNREMDYKYVVQMRGLK